MTDYATFITGAAGLLTKELPMQSLDSAVAFVTSYISDVGGWVPVIQQNPNGDGAPANGFTQQQVADAITTQQFGEVYDLNFNLQITLNVQMVTKLGAGLTLNAATTAMTSMLQSFVDNAINNSSLPIRQVSNDSIASVSGASELGGLTTAAIRVGIATTLAGVNKIVDYKALALKYARNTYGIDNTWNVKSVYTEVSNPIAVIIAKYTNSTTFTTLDGGTTRIYVFFISPVTYEIVSGAIIG